MTTTGRPAPPYWRLSGFYFFYFASLGALLPYWPLYLQSLGFSSVRIGELIAVVMATKIVAPNVWGWIADHTGARMKIIRLASLAAALIFAGVLLGSDYWWLALVMTGFSFFWNAALPQFEATTLNHLGDASHRYSNIRLWGSVGFILAVAGLGTVLERYDPGLLPWVLLALFGGIFLMSLAVPESAAGHLPLDHEPLGNVLRRPVVMALFGVCFLMAFSHGPYYAFYTIYLEENGYARNVIGQLWALGVIAEIVVFLFMHRWMGRYGARMLLLASLFLATLRWVLVAAFVDTPAIMAFAQLLHAASFGVYHAVAIHLVHRLFQGRHQGRGQALYSSLSFGAGGAAGALYSGYAWEAGGAWLAYGASALACLVALCLALRGIPARVGDPGPAVRVASEGKS